ncbi:MAG: hypothetical protein IJS99_09955 [Synergistaceae bacterium]|nr:hypothetical protein [Synergistaceae bacterium]
MRKFAVYVLILALSLVINSSVWAANLSVRIDAAHFPDPHFREYVKYFDSNGDGILSDKEIAAVRSISEGGYDVLSLAGIEYFTNLEYLSTGTSPNLTKLDVSRNTKLKELRTSSTNLIELNISGCTELQYLELYAKLSNLDLSNCKKLQYLSLEVHEISNLDLSNSKELIKLSIVSRNLNHLDLSNNIKLQGLYCNCYSSCYNRGNLDNLDLSRNTELQSLGCNYSKITKLDLSNNKKLTHLDISHNSIQNLDLSNNINLQYLQCISTSLDVLDLSNNII